MGDRVLFQVINSKNPDEFSPALYGHWSGDRAPEICAKLRNRMLSRPGDVQYTAARCVQELTAADPNGALSFGIWNVDARLTEEDSHGDAGVVLIDVAGEQLNFICFGGYLVAKSGGAMVGTRHAR